MALVSYSDSESSDTETPAPAPAPAASKPTRKAAPRSNKKIRLDLPALKPEPGQDHDAPPEPAHKRAKTAGAFSGFNSFLPAPKRSGQNAPKAGVSLKTSSEAAFSRTPVPKLPERDDGKGDAAVGSGLPDSNVGNGGTGLPDVQKDEEVKPVGKTTRFMPLSVANAKKKRKTGVAMKAPVVDEKQAMAVSRDGTAAAVQVERTAPAASESEPKPKPKASLFSFGAEKTSPALTPASTTYEPEFITQEPSPAPDSNIPRPTSSTTTVPTNPNTLSDLASDLNLTPAQRRQLFGRTSSSAQTADTKVTHFNMDAEYKSNQELAASGEAFEHRAVKTVAAGKHSLTQLVNNVKGQTDALEDKWAEGRRARGEGGSKYGWGK